jgi:hypothetical protein
MCICSTLFICNDVVSLSTVPYPLSPYQVQCIIQTRISLFSAFSSFFRRVHNVRKATISFVIPVLFSRKKLADHRRVLWNFVLLKILEIIHVYLKYNNNNNNNKVKESRNGSGVAQRVPGGLGSQISMTFGTWRWWGCQPHAPAAFTPRKCSWYSFSLGAESTSRLWCGR